MSFFRKVDAAALFICIFLFIGGCGMSPGRSFIGDWLRIDESGSIYKNEWVKISGSGDKFFWENPDGKFPAELVDGKMNIDFDGFPGSASFDRKSGILTFGVHGVTIRYVRKK